MSLKLNIEIEYPIPEDRYDDVIVHLRNNFFPDEPLNCSVNLCQPGQAHKGLEDHCLKTLKDKYSIMAYETSTGEIAGVVLSGIVYKGDYETELENLKTVKDEKFKRIFTLLFGASKDADLFNKYGVNELFEIRILSVDKKYRNKGIANKLFARSLELAKKNGFKVLKTDASSKYSQKSADRNGFKVEHEVIFEDYKTENGEVIFNIPQPHISLQIMSKLFDVN
ncbi:arylalkylamine N-acetyltransferase-like 7 [Lycorma delicatula]|uniref:arylalkylamine N-acetyltransferase-like 7 n=1 Tax=Lycorma delicatula TaxID=130591 RepID=UPI003F51A68E